MRAAGGIPPNFAGPRPSFYGPLHGWDENFQENCCTAQEKIVASQHAPWSIHPDSPWSTWQLSPITSSQDMTLASVACPLVLEFAETSACGGAIANDPP